MFQVSVILSGVSCLAESNKIVVLWLNLTSCYSDQMSLAKLGSIVVITYETYTESCSQETIPEYW